MQGATGRDNCDVFQEVSGGCREVRVPYLILLEPDSGYPISFIHD